MLLLLRPQPQLPTSLEKATAMGLHAMGLPIATLTPIPFTLPPETTALILTSARAVTPALSPNLPTYCVGEETAHAARAAHLNVVHTGNTNADSLAQHIAHQNLSPQHFAHPHASNAQTGWYSTLRQAGHGITGVTAYTPTFLPSLPANWAETLPLITHTLCFSAETTQHYLTLLANIGESPQKNALCISAHVAKAAQGFPQITVAPHPTLQSMLEWAQNNP